MSKDTSVYQSPLVRYASPEMQQLFSADRRYGTWRKLWVALAEAECELGLKRVTEEQIKELRAHVDDINYDRAAAWEHKIRHDVMAHVKAYGEQCPGAADIIHLGATSCYVTDNTDLLLMAQGLDYVKAKLLKVIGNLREFALEYDRLPTLGYTHFQPAMMVTVGKRATLWLQDLLMCVSQLNFARSQIRLLGCRGATGTSASMMELFDGDVEKVTLLDHLIAEKVGAELLLAHVFPVSGQTYPRTLDIVVMNALDAIGAAASKMARDIRLLQHEGEVEEPFEKNQVGSSAMPFKRNPMRCERICSLAVKLHALAQGAHPMATTQWLERTLDDSALRRSMIPEGFLVADGILKLCANVTDGLVVYERVIDRHLREKLPFMLTESILMRAVEKGGDRQELHERIRQHSMRAVELVKMHGKECDLLAEIMNDESFSAVLTDEDIKELSDPQKLVGNCKGQVEEFVRCYVDPVLKENEPLVEQEMDLSVNV